MKKRPRFEIIIGKDCSPQYLGQLKKAMAKFSDGLKVSQERESIRAPKDKIIFIDYWSEKDKDNYKFMQIYKVVQSVAP